MKKQHLCLLLLISVLASNLACGDNDTAGESTTATENTSENTVSESLPKSGVPDGFDLGGITINIWSPSDTTVVSESYISLNSEETGDVLNDAVYAANRAVEEKLYVSLNFDTDISVSEAPNKIRSLIMADDTTYDAFHFIQWAGAALSAEGLYMNLRDAPYISFDAPWWDKAYMKEMTVGNKALYCLVGDYAVDRTRNLNCVFFNKKLYNDYYGDADALYTKVLDGSWTIDSMREISSEVYKDINGDGVAGREDILGYCINTLSNLDGFFYGSGANVTSRDHNDIPYLDMMSEHTADVCAKLYELVYETEGVFISGSSFDEELQNRKKFAEDTSMFLVGFFYTAESLRDMNADYGIVPIPKFDKKQDDYITGLHNIMRDIALPVNCQKYEAVCAVLEELAFQGNQTVVPAYYEVVLKGKFARDEASAQMLDIIRDNCTTEIAYIYGTYFNNIGLLFRNMISQKSPSIAALYASAEPAAQEKMMTLIKQFDR